MSRKEPVKQRRVLRCPVCGKPRVHQFRPFCSARCRDVDLGRWFSGAYAVPVVEREEEEAPAAGEDREAPED